MYSTFNPEDKITYDELAPSLQQLIDAMSPSQSLSAQMQIVDGIASQIGGNRTSITANLANIANPQQNKEIAVNMGDDMVYTYKGPTDGWKPTIGVYA